MCVGVFNAPTVNNFSCIKKQQLINCIVFCVSITTICCYFLQVCACYYCSCCSCSLASIRQSTMLFILKTLLRLKSYIFSVVKKVRLLTSNKRNVTKWPITRVLEICSACHTSPCECPHCDCYYSAAVIENEWTPSDQSDWRIQLRWRWNETPCRFSRFLYNPVISSCFVAVGRWKAGSDSGYVFE